MPWSTAAAAAIAPAELNPIARAAATAVFRPRHRGGWAAGAVEEGWGPVGGDADCDDGVGSVTVAPGSLA
ncbi:hypothetical protein [Janibacter sp. GS2]|uniref:hypothetical protein n=1 Tax=Janibacter sp. GS2 TaxID=3442646 RepID=UPI003EBF8DF9